MALRKRQSRISWRNQGGAVRAYADFREYRDVGGRREALIPDGDTLATTDPKIAEALMARRLEELRALREGRTVEDRVKPLGLADLARQHLLILKETGDVTDGWIEASEGFLRRAVTYFTPTRRADSITPSDIRKWTQWLHTVETKRGKPLKEASILHHLNTLSRLFRRADELGAVVPGYNPVRSLLEKPKKSESDTEYYEVHEAALLLEVARTLPSSDKDVIRGSLAYALLATVLLTGARQEEVLGLELDDISFDRRTVHFRPNKWRGLKTKKSKRIIRLWPQLEEVLRDYVLNVRVRQPGRLLFPSFETGDERMFTDIRKFLDRVAVRAGFLAPVLNPETGKQRRNAKGSLMWTGRHLRTRPLRHTYCSARLQTLDRGEPVSTFTVSRELGHSSEDMVQRVYSHLGEVRHRSEVVEFRVEQHIEVLADRLKALGFDTTLTLPIIPS